MNSCILLAAGESQRFGSPKALATIDSQSVIERLQRELLATKLQRIVVVLGSARRAVEPFLLKHKKIKVVYNKDHNLGQTSSFKAGLKAAKASANAFLLPVDYPFVKAGTIDALIERMERETCEVLIPTYKTKRGHPPVFAASLNAEILSWPDAVGLNELVHRHASGIRELSVDDAGVVSSFNTRAEFDALLLDHSRSKD